MVNTAADAEAVVRSAKFPPAGIKGQGSAFACFGLGLATPPDYVAKANDCLITMVKAEMAEAVKNIDGTCQVADVVLIGSNDLALSLLGYAPAKWTESSYIEAIDTIVSTAKRHGKKTGMVVTNGEGAKKAREQFDFVVLTADVRALQAWYGRELEIART